jgi:hypothetical protein
MDEINRMTGHTALQGTSSQNKRYKPDAKDEFERMTDWGRTIQEIWSKIKWLRTYSTINKEAMRKITKKFMKNYFKLKDNTIDKQLNKWYDSKEFN